MIGVGYGVYRSLRSWIVQAQLRQTGNPDQDHIEDVMVKDPVCQVYFPKKEGIRLKHEGRALYFCSRECLEKFKQKTDGE